MGSFVKNAVLISFIYTIQTYIKTLEYVIIALINTIHRNILIITVRNIKRRRNYVTPTIISMMKKNK